MNMFREQCNLIRLNYEEKKTEMILSTEGIKSEMKTFPPGTPDQRAPLVGPQREQRPLMSAPLGTADKEAFQLVL